MGKSTKADKEALVAANAAALNCFPKAALIKAIEALAKSKAAGNEAKEGGESASLHIMRIAQGYAAEAAVITDDVSTVLADWRANVDVLALDLAGRGSKFAEIKVGKDGAADTARLTGTGNNVMSIAKGVVDFAVTVDDCAEADEKASYRSVRTVVESLRKERRDKTHPEAAAMEAARTACREAFKELSDLVFGQNDIDLVESLTASLTEALADEVAAIEAANQIAIEAAAKKADAK